MAETVAINKRKQKAFKSSVDNYKQLLKTGKIQIEENVAPVANTPSLQERGIVYLSNIPHGFYEQEMKQYFCQFGRVTRLRLARSKNSGRSRGYAFIEFKEPEVAKIVAETMDKYLMCKRLLKASYISPEEQHEHYFKGNNWTATTYPKVLNRKRNIKRNHATKSEKQVLTSSKKYLNNIDKVKKKLQEIGITYDFRPVDLPTELKSSTEESSDDKDEDMTDDSETDEDTPVLEIDESDESIIFQPPTGMKKVFKQKPVTQLSKKTTQPKSKKTKSELSKPIEKKLIGISKKTKPNKAAKIPLEKESKKFKMIQKNILVSDQVNLKTKDDMKKKGGAKSKKAVQKSPKMKKLK